MAIEQDPNDWRIISLNLETRDGQSRKFTAKLDTGADMNMMSASLQQSLGLSLHPDEIEEIICGDSTGTIPKGRVVLSYRAGKFQNPFTENFLVLESMPRDIILGNPFMLHAHAVTLNDEFAHPKKHIDFMMAMTRRLSESKVLLVPPLRLFRF